MITKSDIKILSEIVLEEKEKRSLTWNELAKNIPIEGNSLRMSFKRNMVKINSLKIICNDLSINIEKELSVRKEIVNSEYLNSILIGRFEYDYYRKNYDREDYLTSLPDFIWRRKSDEIQDDTMKYRTFEILNNEMNDSSYRSILIGDFVLCRLIPRVKLKDKISVDAIVGYLHWEKGVQFRFVSNVDFRKKELELIALNKPEYKFNMNFNECAEFYELVQLDRQTKF